MNSCDWNSLWCHKKAWGKIVILVIVQELEWNAFPPHLYCQSKSANKTFLCLGTYLEMKMQSIWAEVICSLFLKISERIAEVRKEELIKSSLRIPLPVVPWHEALTWLLLLGEAFSPLPSPFSCSSPAGWNNQGQSTASLQPGLLLTQPPR